MSCITDKFDIQTINSIKDINPDNNKKNKNNKIIIAKRILLLYLRV